MLLRRDLHFNTLVRQNEIVIQRRQAAVLAKQIAHAKKLHRLAKGA